jgi:hypothetical protein
MIKSRRTDGINGKVCCSEEFEGLRFGGLGKCKLLGEGLDT